jgi:hypothetical protein
MSSCNDAVDHSVLGSTEQPNIDPNPFLSYRPVFPPIQGNNKSDGSSQQQQQRPQLGTSVSHLICPWNPKCELTSTDHLTEFKHSILLSSDDVREDEQLNIHRSVGHRQALILEQIQSLQARVNTLQARIATLKEGNLVKAGIGDSDSNSIGQLTNGSKAVAADPSSLNSPNWSSSSAFTPSTARFLLSTASQLNEDYFQQIKQRMEIIVLAHRAHIHIPEDYTSALPRLEVDRPACMYDPESGYISFNELGQIGTIHDAFCADSQLALMMSEVAQSEVKYHILRLIANISSFLEISSDGTSVRSVREDRWPGDLFGFLTPEQRCIVGITTRWFESNGLQTIAARRIFILQELSPWTSNTQFDFYEQQNKIMQAWSLSTNIMAGNSSDGILSNDSYHNPSISILSSQYYNSFTTNVGADISSTSQLTSTYKECIMRGRIQVSESAQKSLFDRLNAFTLLSDAGRHSSQHVYKGNRPTDRCYVRCLVDPYSLSQSISTMLSGVASQSVRPGDMPVHIRTNSEVAGLIPLPIYFIPPLSTEESIDGSVSFSLRITAAQPFNTLHIGFRQNSIFARSYFLQLIMGSLHNPSASSPFGHGMLIVRDNARQTLLADGQDVFEPIEADPFQSPSSEGNWSAKDSTHPRSATAIRLPPPPSASKLYPTRTVALPALQPGSIFTCRYDASTNTIRFELDGEFIPGAEFTNVLRVHEPLTPQLENMCPAVFSSVEEGRTALIKPVQYLHAFLPVLFARGQRIEVECASEEEAIIRRESMRAAIASDRDTNKTIDTTSSAFSVKTEAFSFNSLPDLSAEFASIRSAQLAATRLASSRNGTELDPHMESLVPCAASSIPGLLRLFFHDWQICQLIGTAYLPISIIDTITEYMFFVPARNGTRGFKWMTYWAQRIREGNLLGDSAVPTQHPEVLNTPEARRFQAQFHTEGVTQLFNSIFPFQSKQSLLASSKEVYHHLTAVGEISRELRMKGAGLGQQEQSAADIAMWSRFADRTVEELRIEDMDALQKEAGNDNASGNVAAGPFSNNAVSSSSSSHRPPLQDEDGHFLYNESLHDQLTQLDQSLEEWRIIQMAELDKGNENQNVSETDLPPPFCQLSADDLSGATLSAIDIDSRNGRVFDLRILPFHALEQQRMQREQQNARNWPAGVSAPWYLRENALPLGTVSEPPIPEGRSVTAESVDNQPTHVSAAAAPAPPAAAAAAAAANPFGTGINWLNNTMNNNCLHTIPWLIENPHLQMDDPNNPDIKLCIHCRRRVEEHQIDEQPTHTPSSAGFGFGGGGGAAGGRGARGGGFKGAPRGGKKSTGRRGETQADRME